LAQGKPVNISTTGLRYKPNNGQIQALDGTSIPTYSFINSNTMGMYFENGLLSFTNNSTRRMSVSTNGVVLYNTNGPQIQFNSSAGDRVV
jgi:flagellar basal body rod protein FlgF